MSSRKTSQDQLAEVARRRLEQLSAELAEIRPEQPATPPPRSATDGPQRWSPGSLEAATGCLSESDDRPGGRDTVTRAVVGAAAGRHAHRSMGPAGRLSGWVRDRLPPTLQGGASLSVAHLAVVVTALVAAVLATVWWVPRGDDDGDGAAFPVAAPPSALVTVPATPAGSPGSPSTTGPSASATQGRASPTGEVGAAPGAGSGAAPGAGGTVGAATGANGSVVVDVAGKVRRPGIATLPLGARVVDALEAQEVPAEVCGWAH